MWWCKSCCKKTLRFTDVCPNCNATGTLIRLSGTIATAGPWECCICFEKFPSFVEQCATCRGIGTLAPVPSKLTVKQKRERTRWAKLVEATHPEGVRVWAQRSSFKVLDPTLLRGFCRAFCMYWIFKRWQRQDFWDWIETVGGRVAIINLQVAYQHRKTKVSPLEPWRQKDGETRAEYVRRWIAYRKTLASPSGGQRVELWTRKGKEAYPELPGQIHVEYQLFPRSEDGVNCLSLEAVVITDDVEIPLEVGSSGGVTVPGTSSYRNVLRLQQLENKRRDTERKHKLDNDLGALDRALTQSSRELKGDDLVWVTQFFKRMGVEVGWPQRVSSKIEVAEVVCQSPGLKLISLKNGAVGHAVAAHVLEDRVVYMDPNEGEYVVSQTNFPQFFKEMCGKGYEAFFVTSIG